MTMMTFKMNDDDNVENVAERMLAAASLSVFVSNLCAKKKKKKKKLFHSLT